MSADNGIFILQTLGKEGTEYRVAYAHAIDNIYGEFNDHTLHYDLDKTAANQYFGSCQVFRSSDEAFAYAAVLSHSYDYLEYGICLLSEFAKVKFIPE